MISEFHLRGWNRIPEVEIVALGDKTAEKAESRRREYVPGAQVYSGLKEMLAQTKPDFVDILTPPASHLEYCLVAREAGLHIICQKPLCCNLDDARRLAVEMLSYPKVFAVHENHRCRPWFQIVRRNLLEGLLGQPCLVQMVHLNASEPKELFKNEAETGVLLEYGSHLVDMMRSLLGEPLRVYARMHHLNSRVRGESLVHAIYEYPDCTAVVEVAWKSSALTQGWMLLVGNEGEAHYEGTMTRGDSARLRISRGSEVLLDAARRPYDDYIESFYLFERECTDAMLGWGRIVQTVQEHLRTLGATFAAYESCSRKAVVDIPQ
jgi:predicted dehydrogenase